jgi:SAM-dependent methyltransferase
LCTTSAGPVVALKRRTPRVFVLMKKQVNISHYSFSEYMDKKRWTSVWHQLDEIISAGPSSVLEIGPGVGLFKAAAAVYGLHVETFDIDPDLKPDHLGSVFEMAFGDGEFDAVCAFQMLEHLEYENVLRAVKEMGRVAKSHLILSVPEATKRYPLHVTVPKVGMVTLQIPYPHLRPIANAFDGQHYWELGRRGYPVDRIATDFARVSQMKLERQYLVPEHPRHRFFVFRR